MYYWVNLANDKDVMVDIVLAGSAKKLGIVMWCWAVDYITHNCEPLKFFLGLTHLKRTF